MNADHIRDDGQHLNTMKTNIQATQGKDPQQTKDEASLDDAFCLASFTSVEDAERIIDDLACGVKIGVELASQYFINLLKR